MERSRTAQLLGLLEEDERREIGDEIAETGRDTLHRLFAWLSDAENRSGEEEKRQLFLVVFERAWTKKEDYLLRNELRLLNERLYDLIARRENSRDLMQKKGRYDLMLLRGLLKRKAFRTFESLYKRLYAEQLECQNFRAVWRLNEVWFDYLMRYREITPEGMRDARAVLIENSGHLQRIHRNATSENLHRRVVAEQNLLAMGQETPLTTIDLDERLADYDTPYARFHDALSRAHASRGGERVNHARQASEELASVERHFPGKMMFGYAIHASALYADHRYEEAALVFEEGIGFAREQGVDPSPEMVFNYAGLLMRLGKYHSVLQLLDDYHSELFTRPKLRFRSECFRCFCHIFLNDPAGALKAIPPNIRQRTESEHNYFRFIYLILPYLNNDPEGALREARNFLVYFNRKGKNLLFPQEKRIATLYRAFFSTIYNETDPVKVGRELDDIESAINQFVKSEPNYKDYLYVKWLQQEISKRKKPG